MVDPSEPRRVGISEMWGLWGNLRPTDSLRSSDDPPQGSATMSFLKPRIVLSIGQSINKGWVAFRSRSTCHGVKFPRGSTMFGFIFISTCLSLGSTCKTLGLETRPLQNTDASSRIDSENIVGELIEQLGANSYATRTRAKESLQRIGLEAFDQLQSAQFHPDNEIALTARYLITSLNVSWSKESDPPEVRETLQEYGGLDERERERRIARLAAYSERAGLSALVRICNYERSNRLRRLAAMTIMEQDLSVNPAGRSRNGELIIGALVINDRAETQWLSQYAADLIHDHYDANGWRQLIQNQRSGLVAKGDLDSQGDRLIEQDTLLAVVRRCATRAHADGQMEEAIALAVQHSDLIEPTTRDLIAASAWAIDHQLHPFVLELQRQHRRMFSEHPMLLYGAAEAEQVSGEAARGEQLAMQALNMNPLPPAKSQEDSSETPNLQPREIEEIARAHREIATQLAGRGRFEWAEKELRQIVDSLEIDSISAAIARSDLSVLLADLQRHREVAELLMPLIDRLEKDATLKQQLIRLSTFNYSFIISSAQYHSALGMIDEGNLETARPLLAQAFQRYPVNVDILISMYQLDGDETWRNLVDRTLEVNVRQIEQSIQDVREDAKRFGQPIVLELGYQLNQYAWLVANTTGNKEKALKYSLESLNISNDSAKMDTCARCYFAVKDYDNALRMQKLALKQSPYSPPLLRQLKLIEDAIENQKSSDAGKSAS